MVNIIVWEVRSLMGKMSNELLIESYISAVSLKLSPDFISLLEYEMLRRFITFYN